MNKKTCFVISPIGEKDSDIRKHADSFLKLLAEPALAEFGFNIIRADQIAKSSVITNDIVEFVQQSELCLVDLTFNNPNVFYECGRRHENGKPTIQLIKEGEKLPFDVAGIRTIEYNLSDPWTTLASVNVVKEFIRLLEENDSFNTGNSGVSLTTIAQSLNRIEKKLSNTESNSKSIKVEDIDRSELLTMHPGAAFNKAVANGDIDSAKFLLKRLIILPDKNLYFQALAMLSTIGDEASKNILLDTTLNKGIELNENDYRVIFSGLKDYYINTDSEKIGLEEMSEIFKLLSEKKKGISNITLGFILNIKQNLEYQTGNYSQAIKTGLKVVKLCPDDHSYWYNLSLNYEKNENLDEAAEAAIKFLSLIENPKSYHIDHFKEVMILAKRESEIEALLESKKM